MTSLASTASGKPSSTMTLKVTPEDATRFVSMTKALAQSVNAESNTDLHQQFYRAIQSSKDFQLKDFWGRFQATMIPAKELKAGLLLLHKEGSATDKLSLIYRSLAVEDAGLDKNQCNGLFRSLLTAITCCIQANELASPSTSPKNGHQVVVEGNPQEEDAVEPPRKKIKTENTSVEDFRTTCQSPSFDSSLATLRDEDEMTCASLRKEIDQISLFAAEKVTEKNSSVTIEVLKEWSSQEGKEIVPWLELLDYAKWESVAEKCDSSSLNSPKKVQQEEKEDLPTPPSTSKGSNGNGVSEELRSVPQPEPIHDDSRVMVSFDFTGEEHPVPLCISVTHDNLCALRNLLHRTGIMHLSCLDVCHRLLHSKRVDGNNPVILNRRDFGQAIDRLWTPEVWKYLSPDEKHCFTDSILSILSCFQGTKDSLKSDEVDLLDFSVGLCFFCAGNKSQKLSTGFELLDPGQTGVLTEEQLQRFVSSYLLTLSGLSLLQPIAKGRIVPPSDDRRQAMRSASQSGAQWMLRHFFNYVQEKQKEPPHKYSFDAFAGWYSIKGFNVAPWFELMDLSKLLALIAPTLESPIHMRHLPIPHSGMRSHAPHPPSVSQVGRGYPRDRMSSLRRHHSGRRHGGPPPEVLYTFPLAAGRSLIVMRGDADYMKTVVDKMDLLGSNPESLWNDITKAVGRRQTQSKTETIYVTQRTFVDSMKEICRKGDTEELVRNFYQCFDLDQTDSVALDELMGGLMLLCGGSKSSKLGFAFGIFDTRPGIKRKKNVDHTLSGEDLFLFFRSILIVTFSCCRQSLDMPDAVVSRCICDTANMMCNDVMRHQWEQKQADRLNFDDFGQWYNEGGFERAPWLELLDLKKWVLSQKPETKVISMNSFDTSIPPPPPEDALDPDFLDGPGIMNMDSMDEMDMIFMQGDKDDPRSPKISASFSFSSRSPTSETGKNPLKFHLLTHQNHGGYMLSLSHRRIMHLRLLLEDVGLHDMEPETLCNSLVKNASSANQLTRAGLSKALNIVSAKKRKTESFMTLSKVLLDIFDAFDLDGDGSADVVEIACGMTILCKGKKSDKLEFAFEVLDKKKKGKLNRRDIASYLRSFLTVLLGIGFSKNLKTDARVDGVSTMKNTPCPPSTATVVEAVREGAQWACDNAFETRAADKKAVLTFDHFAEWYTTRGFSTIPWLELLDLRKWVFTSDT